MVTVNNESQQLLLTSISKSDDHLILSTFLGILCVQDTTLKAFLKVINENLLLFTIITIIIYYYYYYLESGFSGT